MSNIKQKLIKERIKKLFNSIEDKIDNLCQENANAK